MRCPEKKLWNQQQSGVLLIFQGPLTVCVQELDGSFKHTVQIEDSASHHELQCHSKSRRFALRQPKGWTGSMSDLL